MKTKIYLTCLMALMTAATYAQKSPLQTAEGKIDGAEIKIVYSAPSARGRKMVGEKDPYGTVWRTGANKATTFEVSKAVKIEGKDLPAGKYELFTIPNESEWVIIFQKFGDQFGAFSYNESNDVLRVKVKAQKPENFVETLNFSVEKNRVVIKWENWLVAFNVKG